MTGDPEKKHISTSYVERANLTMRMGMRALYRLTNTFNKKFENHFSKNDQPAHVPLQLHPHPSDDPLHARNGGRNHRSALFDGGSGCL